MAYEDILFEVEEGIATITFNRPEVLNALKMGTLTEVGEAIRRIADDEEVMRSLLSTALGEIGYDVEAVSNGEEALKRLPCGFPGRISAAESARLPSLL